MSHVFILIAVIVLTRWFDANRQARRPNDPPMVPPRDPSRSPSGGYGSCPSCGEFVCIGRTIGDEPPRCPNCGHALRTLGTMNRESKSPMWDRDIDF